MFYWIMGDSDYAYRRPSHELPIGSEFLKGIVQQKIEILSSFTHLKLFQKLYDGVCDINTKLLCDFDDNNN